MNGHKFPSTNMFNVRDIYRISPDAGDTLMGIPFNLIQQSYGPLHVTSKCKTDPYIARSAPLHRIHGDETWRGYRRSVPFQRSIRVHS